MHTFSPISTQYEIESWIFPHPGVRRLQDARKPGPRSNPRRHSLHPVVPHGRPSGEREERARLKRGHRRWHSNEQEIVYSDLNRSKEDTAKERGLETGSLKTTVERGEPPGRPQHRESMHDVSPQTVSNSGSRSGKACVRPSELLSAVSSSYQPDKQPWVQTQSAQSTQSTPLPLTRHGSHATRIQLLLHPTTSSQQKSTAAHRSTAVQPKGLLRSLSCKSEAMEAWSELCRGAGESHITILGLSVIHVLTLGRPACSPSVQRLCA